MHLFEFVVYERLLSALNHEDSTGSSAMCVKSCYSDRCRKLESKGEEGQRVSHTRWAKKHTSEARIKEGISKEKRKIARQGRQVTMMTKKQSIRSTNLQVSFTVTQGTKQGIFFLSNPLLFLDEPWPQIRFLRPWQLRAWWRWRRKASWSGPLPWACGTSACCRGCAGAGSWRRWKEKAQMWCKILIITTSHAQNDGKGQRSRVVDFWAS